MKCRHCQTEWNMPKGMSMTGQNCPFCGKPLAPPAGSRPNTMEGVLAEMIDSMGRDSLKNGKLMLSYFRDMAPKMKRDQRILGYFVECDGPSVLFGALNREPADQRTCLNRVAQQMINDLVIAESASYMVCQVYWKVLSGETVELAPSVAAPKPQPAPAPDPAPKPTPAPAPAPADSDDGDDGWEASQLQQLHDLLQTAAGRTTSGASRSGSSAAPAANPADFEISGETLVKYKGAGGRITLPSQVKVIGEGAFANCSTLEEVTIPASVHSIGAYAFEGCEKLRRVHIPTTVDDIDMGAFTGCAALEEVAVPGKVERIWGMTFAQCTSLKKVTLLPGVQAISNAAFSGCVNLTEIALPDSLTTIADNAFSKCGKVQVVPSGVWSNPKERRFESVSHLHY